MAVSTTFLAKVKLALRVSSTRFDNQISDLIEEAILDLSYKWFGMDDKYFQAYNDQKMKMSLSSAYRPEVVEDV